MFNLFCLLDRLKNNYITIIFPKIKILFNENLELVLERNILLDLCKN